MKTQKGNGYFVKLSRKKMKNAYNYLFTKKKRNSTVTKLKNNLNLKNTHKKLTRKNKRKLRITKFQKEKKLKLKLTNWYSSKNKDKLTDYLSKICKNKKEANKYLQLYLKYLLPRTINNIPDTYNDFHSNIVMYKFDKNKFLDKLLSYYLNNEDLYIDSIHEKIESLLDFYNKYEHLDKYKEYIAFLENRFNDIKDINLNEIKESKKKSDYKKLVYIYSCLLSFEIQETYKAKSHIKLFTTFHDLSKAINFFLEKKNDVFVNLNYYHKPIVYKRFIFPLFMTLCDLSYYDNEDIIKIIETMNLVFFKNKSKQIQDFEIFCPNTLLNMLECHPKVLLFHYEVKDTSNIFIICKGTSNVAELYQDFTIKRLNTEFGDMHSGFYGTYNSRIKLNIIEYFEKIKSKCKNKVNIFISGHSLGAALSVLVGCDIKDIFSSTFQDNEKTYELGLVSLITYSCPLVGAFNDKYCERKYIDLNFNIYNDADPVCYLQDIRNVVGVNHLTRNYFVDKMITYLTNYAIPHELKDKAMQYPTHEVFRTACKIAPNKSCVLETPSQEFIERIIKLNKYNNQFSYNINTATYNELRGKNKDIQSNINIFHGNYRFENNGEYYSLMGTDYGRFTIKKKDLDEGKKDFSLITEKYKRKLPE